MKRALVIDCPSADGGQGLSEWEEKTVNTLLAAAGFVPDIRLFAFPRYIADWKKLFKGSVLIEEAAAARQKLIDRLAGFDIALTMGAFSLYCLTGEKSISQFRGAHIDSPFVEGLQVVPTYAPEIFSRKAWEFRPAVVSAARKANYRCVDVERRIFIPDTVADIEQFCENYVKNVIAFDVETNALSQITDFSIAVSDVECLYVPLIRTDYSSVWSLEDECKIYEILWRLAQRPDLIWIMHNSVYDLTYLVELGIRPRGKIADTMLRFHGWQPEWEKSLGFLAALHLVSRPWKHLRTKSKNEYEKGEAL